jgi:GAF domain-containing protein
MTSPAAGADSARDLWRRVRELEAIARIASNFTFEQSLESMMADVSREVVQASDSALTCIVGLADRETQLVSRVLGSHGAPENFNATLELAWRTAGTPVVSRPLQDRKAQVLELSELLQRPGYEGVREAQDRAGWARMAVVPMIYRAEAVGLMIIAYPALRPKMLHSLLTTATL